MDTSLDAWIEQERHVAAAELLACISATDSVKNRPAFGRRIRPARGSVVASPSLADWDPDPDYFFHWFRDSALVMDAVRRLWSAGDLDERAIRCFEDFVRFSSACADIDGRPLAASPERVAATTPDHRKFLRSEEELTTVHGPAAFAEARVEADGTIDVTRWARPQYDGPALRALCLLRWLDSAGAAASAEHRRAADRLVAADLACTLNFRQRPCFDLWEEELGLHYYTRSVQAAALEAGARWHASREAHATANDCAEAARDIVAGLDAYWSAADGWFRARGGDPSGVRKDPDIAIVLAALHAGREGRNHGFADPRIASTLARLETYFGAALAINRGRRDAPALGRYAGDGYFAGGAWYLAIFAAAEICYRAGTPTALARGDAFLRTARALTPASGLLSEQIDRDTGAPLSAKRLAWSYAAFVTCAEARAACRRRAS